MINKPTKREELSPQTLDLEKAQAAIKAIIKSAVLYNRAWLKVNTQISRAINLWTPAIEDEEFRERIKKSLYYYATIQYRKAKTELFGLHAGLLPYVVTIRNPKATDEQKRKAAEKITLANPQLQQIVEPVGRYWETAQPLNEFTETYAKKVEKTFRELADSEAKDSYSSNVSLRNVAEMHERSERQKEELKALTEQGEDLVWISTHGNCSERCEPWQGKLYSISGRRGEIDGKKFRPLSDATDIYYTTKSGKTYKNGCISGFNCRHFLIPYRKGNGPIRISAETIEKERDIEKTQRYLERETRRAKKLSIGLKEIDSVEAAKQWKKAKELYKKYVDYSNANKVAFYPWRCKVFDGEELINNDYKR